MTEDQIITLIANIINGIGLFLVVLSMVFKKKKKIIFCQGLNQIFSGCAYFMLKGYAGLMLNIVTLIMDIFIFFDEQTKTTSIIFALLTFVLGFVGVYISSNTTYNTLKETLGHDELVKKMAIEVVFSSLPVIGTSVYNVVTLKKDIPMFYLRLTFLISCLLWALFSLHIKSYVGFIFNVVAVIVNIIRSITIKLGDDKNNDMKQNA